MRSTTAKACRGCPAVVHVPSTAAWMVLSGVHSTRASLPIVSTLSRRATATSQLPPTAQALSALLMQRSVTLARLMQRTKKGPLLFQVISQYWTQRLKPGAHPTRVNSQEHHTRASQCMMPTAYPGYDNGRQTQPASRVAISSGHLTAILRATMASSMSSVSCRRPA